MLASEAIDRVSRACGYGYGLGASPAAEAAWPTAQCAHRSAGGHQLRKPCLAGRIALGGCDPVQHALAVAGWGGFLKEPPRGLVALECAQHGRGQLGHTRLLMGVDGRLVRLSVGKGREPSRGHAARRLQLLHLGDVDRAPDGRRLARGEADRIRVLVNAPPDAIDPAKAQGFVHRLRPAHAGAARAHLVKAHEQPRRAVCMALQPLAERLRGGKEGGGGLGGHGAANVFLCRRAAGNCCCAGASARPPRLRAPARRMAPGATRTVSRHPA